MLSSTAVLGRSTTFSRVSSFGLVDRKTVPPNELIATFRGGAARNRRGEKNGKTKLGKSSTGKTKLESKSKKKPGVFEAFYKSILPLTKLYIGASMVLTVAGLVLGDETMQSLFALDPIQTINGMQIWRFLTAASFIGLPSMGWLLTGYHLISYGSALEQFHGTAQHFIFLITQLCLLSCTSMLLGLPFFASSMVSAILHVLCRTDPHRTVQWFVVKVPFWILPYGHMVTDVCQSQSLTACVPHFLGILTGHFYEFHKNIWPKIRGEDWLVAPEFISHRLDPDSAISKDDAPKRKRTKGRKLGAS